MKTLTRTIIAVLASDAPALSARQLKESEESLMTLLFLGFGALIVAFQLFPGTALFTVMLKEIFTGSRKKGAAAASDHAAHKL